MKEVITVGLDIAKQVFQVHGVDQDGNAVLKRKLRRRANELPQFDRRSLSRS